MEVEKTLKEVLDSIRNFKKISNRNDIVEFVNNGKLKLIFPFASSVKIDFPIYRTRPKSNINEYEDLTSVSAFSYVPLELNTKKIPSIGRFNLDGQSIFYSSISGSTNLKEMKDSIKEGDVVYISKWLLKENADIKLYYIYPPEHLKPKSLQDSLLADIVDNHKVDQVTGDILKELGYMLLEDNNCNNVYLKTALIANEIYHLEYNGFSYDAILYPSVQGHEYDLNLAIKPQFVDKNLVLQCVYEAVIKDNKVEIDCSHIGINKENQIQWNELYVYENDISIDSYLFLNIDKCPYTQDISVVYIGNKKYTNPEFSKFLLNEIVPSNESLNKEGFFKKKFTLEDNIESICSGESKYYDVKVDDMFFYVLNIRYDISYIRIKINYINSLRSLC